LLMGIRNKVSWLTVKKSVILSSAFKQKASCVRWKPLKLRPCLCNPPATSRCNCSCMRVLWLNLSPNKMEKLKPGTFSVAKIQTPWNLILSHFYWWPFYVVLQLWLCSF
jgi:hypothetical protein